MTKVPHFSSRERERERERERKRGREGKRGKSLKIVSPKINIV